MGTRIPCRTLAGHGRAVITISFSPDGLQLASGSWDHTVRIWEVETGNCSKLIHSSSNSSVAYSQNGLLLVAGAEGHNGAQVWLRNDQTSEYLDFPDVHKDTVDAITFSMDGKLLGTGSWDLKVRLWKAETLECLFTLDGHKTPVTALAFSPDMSTLASADQHKCTVKLWDTITGTCKATLSRSYNTYVAAVAFSPDGSLLASACGDSVCLWGVETRDCRLEWHAHNDSISGLDFSPSGDVLASSSRDGTIRLWDVRTGKCQTELAGPKSIKQEVVFSPDGSTLASGYGDNLVGLWDIRIKE